MNSKGMHCLSCSVTTLVLYSMLYFALVVGYIVTCPSPETFAAKLIEADRIEGYGSDNSIGYLRSVVQVLLTSQALVQLHLLLDLHCAFRLLGRSLLKPAGRA
jgi:hypothetical protein